MEKMSFDLSAFVGVAMSVFPCFGGGVCTSASDVSCHVKDSKPTSGLSTKLPPTVVSTMGSQIGSTDLSERTFMKMP